MDRLILLYLLLTSIG